MFFEDESGGGGNGADYGRIVGEFDRRLGPLLKQFRRTDVYRRPAAWRSNTLSQHIFGTAADFQVRPDQVAAFTVAARRAGLIPVNELKRPPRSVSPDWTGPHMHVQLYPAKVDRTLANIPPRPPLQISEAP